MLEVVGSHGGSQGARFRPKGRRHAASSGYSVVTGHQEMQPQQVLAAKR